MNGFEDQSPQPDQDAGPNEHPKTRGKGFPGVPLGDARDYVSEAVKYGLSHHVDAFATYLGHQQASGGAFNNKIAAIRDWGLILRSGSTVTLTELAKRLALPTDPAQEQIDLREAFLSCDIFREAYERNAKGQVLNSRAFGNGAVLNLGVAPSARERFVRSFTKSAVTAGLAEEDPQGLILKSLDDRPQGSSVPPAAPTTSPTPTPTAPPPTSTQAGTASTVAGARPAFKQSWQFDGGELEISLSLAGPLPREAYAHIGASMAELIALLEEAQAAARARHAAPDHSEPPDEAGD